MAITTNENILNVFTAYTPWWKMGDILTAFAKICKRSAFHEAMKKLNNTAIRRIVFLTGNRRV